MHRRSVSSAPHSLEGQVRAGETSSSTPSQPEVLIPVAENERWTAAWRRFQNQQGGTARTYVLEVG